MQYDNIYAIIVYNRGHVDPHIELLIKKSIIKIIGTKTFSPGTTHVRNKVSVQPVV